MAKARLDKETRKAILAARKMIEELAAADGNEAETRRRVERIFEWLMGYDVFKHLSREHAIQGAGETEHCDFAIQLDADEDANPAMLIELKRVNIELAPKHLKQASSYAINTGCEWILLTNGRDWRLYHVSFGQPPQIKLIRSWDLMGDDIAELADDFALISYRSIRKRGLRELWRKANVLTARNILRVIVSETSLKLIRRELRKATGVLVQPEDIVGAVRRLLNEVAEAELEGIKITLPRRDRRPRRKTPEKPESEQQDQVANVDTASENESATGAEEEATNDPDDVL